MRLNNLSTKSVVIYGITIIWFGIVIVGFWFMLSSRLVWYDPEQQLLNHYSGTDEYLQAWQGALPPDLTLPRTLLKIEQPGCACNSIYLAHWQQLAETYQQTTFIELDVNTLIKPVRELVINLPIVVYINAAAEVTYVGPMSAGPTCDSSNSLIEAYLIGQASLPYVPFSLRGCYCL